MSKTMDTDYKLYATWKDAEAEANAQATEIERLKVADTKLRVKFQEHSDTLRTRLAGYEKAEPKLVNRILIEGVVLEIREDGSVKAVLEALKPKPVETCVYLNISGPNFMSWGHCSASTGHNLKLTFEDDKLVKAEII